MKISDNLFAHWLGWAAEALTAYMLEKRERLRLRRNLIRAAIVVLGMASALVFGAAGYPPTPQVSTKTAGAYDFTVDSTIRSISSKVMEKVNALASNEKLKSAGKLITAFFLVAMMIWTSLKSMAGAKGLGELIGEWIPIFVAFGVVTLFLDKSAGDLIVSTMDNIGAAIGGSSMATLESALTTGTKPIFEAIAAVVNQPRATEGANVASEGGLTGWIATMAASSASFIMGAIAKVVTAFVLVMAGVIMMAHVIMAFISIQLVLALAPVMVPFLMFKPLEWLFSSWLKFLLGACMLKIVVAFLLQISAGLLTGMHELALAQYRESYTVTALETLQVDILMLGMTMVFAILATLLLMQAPGIATGLLAGSAGSTGFSGVRGLTMGVGGRGAAAGAGGAVSAGQGAASRGVHGGRVAHAAARGLNDRMWNQDSKFSSGNKSVQAAYQRAKGAPPTPPPGKKP
jgi:type IV secretion system protein TrbL